MVETKIICVDDNKEIRNLIVEIFKDEYNITTVSSGKEAMDLTKSFNPNIAIVDMNLDDMNGIDLLNNLKEYNRNIKSIIITGSDNLIFKDINKDMPNKIVKKPFDIFELKKIVRELSKNYEI